ncbi:major facilitator superfamily domain-containing protein [Phaeosphaeria sp. MPI-PUGE-AT-0046c]|nr:major facilitator superfamily domain-containing protein [Phaeosphaeria sp. MPI-PUGE-AT-0046c]
MATNPEIDLPHLSELGSSDVDGPGISTHPKEDYESRRPSRDPTSDNEKEDVEDSEQEQDGRNVAGRTRTRDKHGEIIWQYLTFETELPHPATIHPLLPDQGPPPELPSLAKYGDPFQWSQMRKSVIIWVACVITALTAASAGSYTPGIGQMTAEWGIGNVAALVGITMFTAGFGIAPMVLAPFSEINGRRPVFIASGILFVICQLGSGLAQSYAGMLVVRFLAGVGGSTFSTMIGGVVADIYQAEDRNTPMALFSGSVLVGTGLGPLVSGFVAQNLKWRWIFYIQAIADGLLVCLIIITFEETRGSVLISRKAKVLNKYYEEREAAGYFGLNVPIDEKPTETTVQRIRWKVKADEDRASLTRMISLSLYRPFHLLFTEPVVFWFSLWVAFSWAVLYLTLAAIPLVFQSNHGFSLQQANAVFAAMCIASIFATVLSIYQEKIARRYGKLANSPEGRLYFACVESACMPIGLFMFGWTSFSSIHWIAPTIAIGIATIGIFAIYLSTFNYLADTYHRYASSALAAQSFCRNMLGGVFPLITTQMYNRLGYGPASSLLGGIGTLLTIVPWILVFYGPRIRARSKFASEIMDTK